MAKGYRIGYPEEDLAWKVMEFEYTELGNEHILQDLSDFLRMGLVYTALSWKTTLAEFRRRYGDARGIWLCKSQVNALLWYGKYYGEGAAILEYEYDPRNIVIELGPDGTFILEPTFIQERWADPLYPLKRDLARIFRWHRR